MSFQVRFYNCGAQQNVVDKTLYLRTSTSMNCVLKENTSIISPVLIVEAGTGVDMTKFNYAHIPDFNNRKYFVTDIISINHKMWEVHLKCDVLYSFAADILKSYAICTRSNLGNAYIPEAAETEKASTAISYVVDPIGSAAIRPYNILLVSSGV